MEFLLGLILIVQCLEEKGSQIKWYQKENLILSKKKKKKKEKKKEEGKSQFKILYKYMWYPN